MAPLVISVIVAVLVSSNSVDCGYASAGSGSHSSSNGASGTYTQTNNNGQGQFSSTSSVPGGGFTHQYGTGNPYNPGYYGPSNFNQNGFGTGAGYGPGFGYNPFFNAQPVYNPFPNQPFGFNAAFTPFQPAPVPTPQEFNNYLNSLQQQYLAFFKQHQDYLNTFRNPQTSGGFGAGPNYAYATGGYGPNGIHQTAGVYPPNKNNPNVDSRFGAEDNAGAPNPAGGFFGVSTSSFSSSSDVNGVKTHKEGAVTAVNDNGKVTIHKVEN